MKTIVCKCGEVINLVGKYEVVCSKCGEVHNKKMKTIERNKINIESNTVKCHLFRKSRPVVECGKCRFYKSIDVVKKEMICKGE